MGLLLVTFLGSCQSATPESDLSENLAEKVEEAPRELDQEYLDFILEAADQFHGTGDDFDTYKMGDTFPHNLFLWGPFETQAIDAGSIPVYLAYFSPSERLEVIEGIKIANRAIGYDLFEVVETWEAEARIIYKVKEISDDYKSGKYSSGESLEGL